MTELTGINEDDCVLDQEQLSIVKEMIGFCCFHDAKHWKNADMIFAKINKLNELAKERKR